MTVVINGTSGITGNSGTVISASTIGVGGATPSASGAGITFPATQSVSTDANTLDDYEEGTWTPTFGGNSTYISQFGFYRKICSLVFISAYIKVNTLGTGSDSVMSGLPFSPILTGSANECVFTVSKSDSLATAVTAITLRNNGTLIYATYRTSSSVNGITNGAWGANNLEINFSGCYIIF